MAETRNNFFSLGSTSLLKVTLVRCKKVECQGYSLSLIHNDSNKAFIDSDWANFRTLDRNSIRVLSLHRLHAKA